MADRYRDLPLPSSAYMAEAITSVIGCSHRTLIVLTESYLANDWCRYELSAALNEAAMDKSHRLIAVVLDAKCLADLDQEMRQLLTNPPLANAQLLYATGNQQQLIQVEPPTQTTTGSRAGAMVVASLDKAGDGVSTRAISRQGGGGGIGGQLATNRISFLNYNERKFWPKLNQLLPLARPSTQTLTLTTKN